MYLLKIYDMPGTKVGKLLGTLHLTEARRGELSGTVVFDVVAEDEGQIARAQVTTGKDLPWKAALVALQALYAPAKPFAWPLRDDGFCNAITERGERCRIPAKPKEHYCLTHDLVRKERE